MKPTRRRQPSAMLTVRVCQALRASVERKRDVKRSQLRAALIERRPPCVIYVKCGSYEVAQPPASSAAAGTHAGPADPPAGMRARRPARIADYEPEAG